jgi:hypothetical protein
MTDRPNAAEANNTDQTNNNPAQPGPRESDRDYDDGLVHNHGWACRERGAPAY